MDEIFSELKDKFNNFWTELKYDEDIKIDKSVIDNKYNILNNYIFAGYTFVSDRKRSAFMEYLFMLIVEETYYENYKKRYEFQNEMFHLEKRSNEYISQYESIKKRIDMQYDDFRNEISKNYDYENEVLVIAFRLLRFFDLNSNQLLLKPFDEPYRVIIFNDYRNNIFICEVKEKVKDYATYKTIKNKVDELKREVEYLNDFVLNYYENNFKEVFCISKVIFDEHNVERNFIQGNVSFKASFKIIQKLIGPLYLNKESYGIREIIQNAVDACMKVKRNFKEIDIIYTDKGRRELPKIIIKDNGIGMNEDIILKKFLTVGESGKDNSTSIGKFGIGLLAAFLISDKLRFKTKYDEEIMYMSEEIDLEVVQKENAFINIKIIKRGEERFDENFIGTEIELTLKKELVNNEKIADIKNNIKQNLSNNLKEILGLKNNMPGSIWYGLAEYLQVLKNEIEQFKDFDNENKIMQNQEFKFNDLNEIIMILKNYNFNLPEEKRAKYINFEEKLYEKCDIILAQLEYMKYIDAYGVLCYLNTNQWYLIDNDEIKIKLFSSDHEFAFLKNFQLDEILNIDCKESTNLVTTSNNAKIGYIWSKKYQGKVFCNNMLIPNNYKFDCNLYKAYKELPTILVDESNTEKLDIDLARENCRLIIDNTNYEKRILSTILKKTLEDYISNGDYQNVYLNSLKWIYFINQEGIVKKAIKNSCWFKENNDKNFYCIILLKKKYDGVYKEIELVKILRTMKAFENCVFEFIESNLLVETTLNDIRCNDLYTAALYNGQVYINENVYGSITNFNPYHLRALVIAAYNVDGSIDITTQNQLKLNTNALRGYQYTENYKKLVQDSLLREYKVNCLNYNYDLNPENIEFLDEVMGVMRFKLNSYSECVKLFETMSRIPRREDIWSGFQEGIYETKLGENEEIFKFLTREYEVNNYE
ncbi:Histidine kinase-, DNA gyrase B-, and HSP90-like ATPase [Anaerosporobacter mobilis DSM 15930]|uniref:Histidine kinase-, DNA gyrase B-, and HSP90-like ATPase n=1 Tax=Anaerosporobacter mobilis DSM 15930 TaxID=1120996 RepID=A0A1M7N8B6_9FIRM|nr:ATP-binding protein [Anaerosporobacter mobilis]SHM99856.1 Histidine kinase-, DNA gyrase B-, and HSP90-like ATPase [Anaerosporobacter mobilis DSM 15930]